MIPLPLPVKGLLGSRHDGSLGRRRRRLRASASDLPSSDQIRRTWWGTLPSYAIALVLRGVSDAPNL